MKTATFLLIVLLLIGCKNKNRESEGIAAFIEAQTAYITGDFATAEKILNPWINNSPISPQSDYLMAKTRFMQDKPQEAAVLLEKLLKNHPQHSDARLWLARSKLAMDLPREAETLLEQSLQWSGEDPRILSLMADCQEILGSSGEALEYYSRAALFEDELIKIYLSLASIYGRNQIDDKEEFYVSKAEALVARDSLYSDAVRMARQSLTN